MPLPGLHATEPVNFPMIPSNDCFMYKIFGCEDKPMAMHTACVAYVDGVMVKGKVNVCVEAVAFHGALQPFVRPLTGAHSNPETGVADVVVAPAEGLFGDIAGKPEKMAK